MVEEGKLGQIHEFEFCDPADFVQRNSCIVKYTSYSTLCKLENPLE